jgi:spermidine/putrescine transport system permease protein
MKTAVESEGRSRSIRLWITSGPGLFWIVMFLLIPSAVLLGIGFFSAR